MKSILAIVAGLAVATMFAASSMQAAPVDATHHCTKCKVADTVKSTDHCPGCHSHMGFDVYGKSSRHGHSVHACSGCDLKKGPCHVAKQTNRTAGL